MKKKRVNRYLRKISALFPRFEPEGALNLFVQRYRESGERLESVIRKLGVAEIVEEELPFDGGIFEISGKLIVKLNSLSSYERRRFTLAHEIGHLVLSRGLKGARECKNDAELERACNVIATELLMPAGEVFSFVRQLGGPSTENLRVLGRKFGVSLHTAARRVHEDLQLWKPAAGLWQWDAGPREKWFVGKRLWATRRPDFAAFHLAKDTNGVVRTREFYTNREYAEAVSLEVLNLGHNRFLGMVRVEI